VSQQPKMPEPEWTRTLAPQHVHLHRHLMDRILTSPSHRRSYNLPICPPSIVASRIVVMTLNCSTRLFLSRASTLTCRISRLLGYLRYCSPVIPWAFWGRCQTRMSPSGLLSTV